MERQILPVLFLLLAQTASTVVANAGSGNGGYQDPEENSLRPEPECRIPPYSDPARIVPGPSNFVEDDSSHLIDSLCYLACVTSGEVRM